MEKKNATKAPKATKASKAPKAPAVEKNRYSPEELQEFKALILEKISKAEKDLEMLQQAVAGSENDVSDTAPTFKTLEEGSNVLLKEENQKLAARQQKFIRDLRAALIRIGNADRDGREIAVDPIRQHERLFGGELFDAELFFDTVIFFNFSGSSCIDLLNLFSFSSFISSSS